jgi:hypothetical protein
MARLDSGEHSSSSISMLRLPFPRNPPDQLPHWIGHRFAKIHPAQERQKRRHLRRRITKQHRKHRQVPLYELIDEGRDWPVLVLSRACRHTQPLPGSSRSIPPAACALARLPASPLYPIRGTYQRRCQILVPTSVFKWRHQEDQQQAGSSSPGGADSPSTPFRSSVCRS